MVTKTTTNKYIEAVGRRKTSVARVRLFDASKTSFVINEKKLPDHFKTTELEKIINSPLKAAEKEFEVTIKVSGGGIHSQAEAVRHGISRALLEVDPELRKKLKDLGFLKRDPRSKERRKFGFKKARKRAQWSKR